MATAFDAALSNRDLNDAAIVYGYDRAAPVGGSTVDIANHADPRGRNGRSVRVELEADCLAGVWGRSAYLRAHVTMTDLYDARKTAEVMGDDYETQAAGHVVDTSLWTHGSSKQRQFWLRRGFRSGRPVACDTFAGQ